MQGALKLEDGPPSAALSALPSFIETQFPVSRLSKESYVERKSHVSQTLTSLGKWWGRKPLIMVRAVILGLLMPASNDPRKDRDVFLAFLTMDEEGLWRRKSRNIPLKEIYRRLSPQERAEWIAPDADPDRPRFRKGIKTTDRARLQRLVFDRMSYDEKLKWCDRPEHVDGPSPEAWRVVNDYLGTRAASLPELVRELGERRFGRVPRVGDAFCGGGSVPFEAARLGCEAYGSDLNPVAALLTWGALEIVGGGEEVAERVRRAQAKVFDAVDRQVTEWRIEHNDAGWRADAFLYCTETTCPECGWRVPLAPSWVIGEKTRAVARLEPAPTNKRFAIDIRSGVGREALAAARKAGTVKQSRLECPNPDCKASTPMTAIRGDRRGGDGRGYGLRLWENDDLVPRPDDVFQERLYCVRWRLPPMDALLWAEQRTRASSPLEDAHEIDRFTRGAGASGSLGDDAGSTPVDSGFHAASPGYAGVSRATISTPPPASPSASPTPLFRGSPPPVRRSSQAHLPDWVDLEHAITALVALLEADEQREVKELRKRDWLAEDRAFEAARREFEAKRDADCPKRALKAATKRLKNSKEAIAERNDRIETLAKSLPRTLYRSIDGTDLDREAYALALLRERFPKWQALGYVPCRTIANGVKTDEPIRTRGWTHWHHLFTPRQLLTHGLIQQLGNESGFSKAERIDLLLGVGRIADWDSKLCRWGTGAARESISQSFYNQAFNTLYNFPTKGFPLLWGNCAIAHEAVKCVDKRRVVAADCREMQAKADIWITDPPYADAISYHELSEFFLAWYEKKLPELFPDWYADSKRVLAVQGADADFRRSMVNCYRNLAAHMPNNGFHVVMFTHQDASVWADLSLILWAAGLRVSAAWTIATETESAFREGNYVQGTVLMVLRKQTSDETAFLDEVVPEVEIEVKTQLDSMLQLDDHENPNFSDADYQLAAYAAALRVLTKYGSIEDIDVAYQLAREQGAGEANPIEAIIKDAVRTAGNFLVPPGLLDHLWRRLGPEEKLYLKGLEAESHRDFRAGVYQEFARGFGVRDYHFLLQTGKANETRLKTASEFKRQDLSKSAFGRSLVRHALYAVWRAGESGEVADSLTWLRTELPDYWPQREALTGILRYLAALDIDHWREDASAAQLVAGAVENDHV